MKEVIRDKTKELLEYIKDSVDKGYNIYSNIDEIFELIDTIVNWYIFKYSENKIIMSEEKYNDRDFLIVVQKDYSYRKIESLDKHMGYLELLSRISQNLIPLIEGWYHDKNNFFDISLSYKNTMVEYKKNYEIDSYDGSIHRYDVRDIETDFKIKCASIEELVKYKDEYKDIDFSDPENVVMTHNLNIELRYKIFELIYFRLFSSSKNIAVNYIRATKFKEEFNKYIRDLDLKFDEEAIYETYPFKSKIGYILDDLYKKDNSDTLIEEFGLSSKALRYLKKIDITKKSEITKLNTNTIVLTLEEYHTLNKKDYDIIDKIKKDILEDLSYDVTMKSIEDLNVNQEKN